jgi:hypothetical protein
MSLVLSAVYQDSVQMLTDGAAIDEDGNLLSVNCKVSISSDPPLAVSGRGDSNLVEMIRVATVEVAKGRTFDETIILVETMLLAIADVVAERGMGFEVVIAGISETHGPCHFAMASENNHVWLPAYQMTRVPSDGVNFGCEWDEEILAAEGVTSEMLVVAGDAALSLFGPKIAEMMRKTSGVPMPGIESVRAGQCIIGGRLDLTTVTAAGAHTELIGMWDDEIGVPIAA